MFYTFTNYTFCLKILLTDVTSSRVPICIRLVLSGKDNRRNRKWCFLSDQRKQIFQLWRRKPFLVWGWFFAFLFCFVCEASFLQRCKLSAKSRTLLSSSRRNANKFSSWAAIRARWLFLFKKGISQLFCFTCYSFQMTNCDYFSIITTQKTVARSFPSEGRLFTAKLITVTIISRDKNSIEFNFSLWKLRKRPERLIHSAPK